MVATLRLFVLSALLAFAVEANVLRSSNKVKRHAILKALEFKHQLRICNAFPYTTPVDVFRGEKEKLTETPMAYKTCRDFPTLLKAGDRLEFKVGDSNVGTFAVAQLPTSDAVLLLVIHRHDTLSKAVSFESHVFANLLNPQVAVIDTFKGKSDASPVIMDAAQTGDKVRMENLRFNGVVAVNPGVYEVALMGKGSNKTEAKTSLIALRSQSYVVLRTGVEADQGPSFPQELVIFPKSDATELKSGAAQAGPAAMLLAVLVAVASAQLF